MKTPQKIFIITLILILACTAIPYITLEKETAKIKDIKYSSNYIKINLENSDELIIFENEILNLDKDQIINYIGKKEKYQNKTQIIVYQISK